MALPAWLILALSAAGGATVAHAASKVVEKPKPKEGTVRPEIKLNVPVSVITGPNIQLKGEQLRGPQINVKLHVLKDPYKGWLGALLLHGSVVQASYLNYLNKIKHIGPDKKVTSSSNYEKEKHKTEPYPEDKNEFLYKFTEYPPPLPRVPTWCPPSIFNCTALERYDHDKWVKVTYAHDQVGYYKIDSIGDLWFRVPGGEYGTSGVYQGRASVSEIKKGLDCEVNIKDEKWYSIYAQTKQIAGILSKAPQYIGFGFNKFPKKPKWPKNYDKITVPFIDSDPITWWFYDRKWKSGQKVQSGLFNEGFASAIERVNKQEASKRDISFPFPGINLAKTDKHIDKDIYDYLVYAQRLRNYYCSARWLVWAAEMWRIHSDYNDYTPPPAWRDYCLMWGIGCAERWRRKARPTLKSFKDAPVPNPIITKKGKTAIPTEVILTRVMELIPVPGGVPAGTEIGRGRLADWPIAAGNLAPPYDFGAGYTAFISNYHDTKEQEEALKRHKIGMAIVNLVVSTVANIVASYAAPLVNSLFSAASNSIQTITQTLRNISNIITFARDTASLFTDQFDVDIFDNLSKYSARLDAKGVFSKLESFAIELETQGTNSWNSRGFSIDLLGNLTELNEIKDMAMTTGKSVFDAALPNGINISNPDIEAPKMVVRLTELRPEIKLVGEVTVLGKSQWS